MAVQFPVQFPVHWASIFLLAALPPVCGGHHKHMLPRQAQSAPRPQPGWCSQARPRFCCALLSDQLWSAQVPVPLALPQTAPAVLLAAPTLLFFLTPLVDMLLGPRERAPLVKVGGWVPLPLPRPWQLKGRPTVASWLHKAEGDVWCRLAGPQTDCVAPDLRQSGFCWASGR